MNKLKRLPWLELMLILSLIALGMQLFWPAFKSWYEAPRPGGVGVGYLDEDYFKELGSITISPGYFAYLPEDYLQQKEFPLVIFLHGSDLRGDNPYKMEGFCKRCTIFSDILQPYLVILPQCRERHHWQPDSLAGFVEFVCKKYRIDRNRVYLVGNSMGGFGTWSTAGKFPDLFAAIIPIAGGGRVEDAAALRDVPVWAFHGDNDQVVDVENSRKMIEAIQAEGGDPKVTIYAGGGHGVFRRVLKSKEVWQWLFQQSLKNRQEPNLPSNRKQ